MALHTCLRRIARANQALVMAECDRRKRRSGNPGDLRSVRTSRRQAYSIVELRQSLRAPSMVPEIRDSRSFGGWHDRPADEQRRAHHQSTAIMTSEAFTTTMTELLTLMPRSSTDSLVIEEVTIWPLPISTRTCEVVAPFLTSTTVPLIWLRALMRMTVLTMLHSARQRHAPADRW